MVALVAVVLVLLPPAVCLTLCYAFVTLPVVPSSGRHCVGVPGYFKWCKGSEAPSGGRGMADKGMSLVLSSVWQEQESERN